MPVPDFWKKYQLKLRKKREAPKTLGFFAKLMGGGKKKKKSGPPKSKVAGFLPSPMQFIDNPIIAKVRAAMIDTVEVFVNAGCFRDMPVEMIPSNLGQDSPGMLKLPGLYGDKVRRCRLTSG